MVESFHISLALGPLAVYMIIMAWIRMIPRPMVVNGGRDVAALAIALSGCVAVGPMELFFPRAAASILGPRVWLLLILLYVLCVLMVILASKPRLIVYGLNLQELEDQLRVAFQELDPGTEWLGEHVQSAQLGISAIVERAGPGHVSQIVAVSHRQDVRGWIALERNLMARLGQVRTNGRSAAGFYLALGVLLLAIAGFALTRDPAATAESMQQMLRW